MTDVTIQRPKLVPIKKLQEHPRNYRKHPQDQIDHLKQSLEQHGFYRNVVISEDDYILAGHGIVRAATQLGMEKIQAVRLEVAHDAPEAEKVLAADNYLGTFAEDDDRLLTDLLKDIAEADSLLGTGFDDLSLAALVMVTRDASEIADFDAAAEWVGMPDFEADTDLPQLVITCDSEQDRDRLVEEVGLTVTSKGSKAWSAPYPPRGRKDNRSIMVEG